LWRARNDLTPRPRFDGLSAAPLPLSSEERRGGGIGSGRMAGWMCLQYHITEPSPVGEGAPAAG